MIGAYSLYPFSAETNVSNLRSSTSDKRLRGQSSRSRQSRGQALGDSFENPWPEAEPSQSRAVPALDKPRDTSPLARSPQRGATHCRLVLKTISSYRFIEASGQL